MDLDHQLGHSGGMALHTKGERTSVPLGALREKGRKGRGLSGMHHEDLLKGAASGGCGLLQGCPAGPCFTSHMNSLLVYTEQGW
jgi:hypothetical protein